jgi:hypothetical protein
MIDSLKVVDSLKIGAQEITSTMITPVEGRVVITAYERGKKVPKYCRDSKNIWTVHGRIMDAGLKSYASYIPLTPVRNDRIKYIGVGAGTQPPVNTVQKLVTPLPYNVANEFLATLDLPTFSVDGTIVTYTRTFGANEISILTTTNISECGLFSDGAPPLYTPGTRVTSLAAASAQSPMAYNTFEPLGKTTDIDLVFRWELRHN